MKEIQQLYKLNNVSILDKAQNSTSPYTESWLPVRNIQNGMILTDDKHMITGVKITPRNIFILDKDEKNNSRK